MKEKVVSLYHQKRQNGKGFLVTDEWLDVLADEFVQAKAEDKTNMTFVHWVEYKTIRHL